MTDIAAIRGLIELQDDFTKELGVAKFAMKGFSDENQASLKAVAGAAGIVVASFTAISAATIALGERGSAVNDLKGTILEFAGSSREANQILQELREGTRNTIDDFQLMEASAKLLSTGVKLNTQDFRTLAEASFVLSDRGFGSVKENLDSVSDALVTGRTKAIAMRLGVVENTQAAEQYAKSLGVNVEMLSATGKAEATRIEVMRLLNEATKSGANIQKDFGDRMAEGRTLVSNFVDELSSAVDESTVFAAGMDTLGAAVKAAFGDNQEQAIQNTVDLLEEAALITVNLGLAGIETARVIHTAWSVMETGFTAVVAIIGLTAETLAALGLEASKALNAVGLVSDATVQEFQEAREVLGLFTTDMMKQTEEAAKGVTQTSEFDAVLDSLGGTLFQVRDAMNAANEATVEGNEASTIAAENARILAETEKQLAAAANQRAIDQEKMAEAIKKSTIELTKLQQEYYAESVRLSGTSFDAQRAQIEANFKSQVAALDKLDPLYKQHYDQLRKNADQALGAVGSGWDAVKDKSIAALQEQARAARETYNQMSTSGLGFTRDVLEAQRAEVERLENAARGMGEAYVDAFTQAAIAAKAVADETERLRKEAEKAKAANMAMGGSFEITRANFEASARGLGADVGLVEALLKKGYSFQQAVLWSKHPDWPPPENPGPRVPGFATGGRVMRGGMAIVGERGPEMVNLPLGARVMDASRTQTAIGSAGSMSSDAREGSGALVLNFHVNGTAEETARRIKKQIMDELRRHRQFSIA